MELLSILAVVRVISQISNLTGLVEASWESGHFPVVILLSELATKTLQFRAKLPCQQI